jgi:hypothetical protein
MCSLMSLIPRQRWACCLVGFTVACAGGHSLPRPPSAPQPTLPSPTTAVLPDSTNRSSWSFSYTPGSRSYRVTRSGEVVRTDTTTSQSVTSTNSTRETLTFEIGGDGTIITAVVDSFAPIAQDSASQQIQLPVEVSASLATNGLTLTDSTEKDHCSLIRSTLINDLQNLVIPIPQALTTGLTWTDTLRVKGCQAGIPTSVQATRQFTVGGELSYGAYQVVEIIRTDSAQIEGEGGLQQHHLTIHAAGTGRATYYLSVNTGQIVHLTVDQVLTAQILATGSRAEFRQHSNQEFVFTP